MGKLTEYLKELDKEDGNLLLTVFEHPKVMEALRIWQAAPHTIRISKEEIIKHLS